MLSKKEYLLQNPDGTRKLNLAGEQEKSSERIDFVEKLFKIYTTGIFKNNYRSDAGDSYDAKVSLNLSAVLIDLHSMMNLPHFQNPRTAAVSLFSVFQEI